MPELLKSFKLASLAAKTPDRSISTGDLSQRALLYVPVHARPLE